MSTDHICQSGEVTIKTGTLVRPVQNLHKFQPSPIKLKVEASKFQLTSGEVVDCGD
jgi:hypothetical protein